ncbi:MAG: hypothetical protein F6J95_026170 [Leptolyngbya sp. SIO1E4]|nr:hypothetical protein [Leptolyngbya sp. SIO1E4]
MVSHSIHLRGPRDFPANPSALRDSPLLLQRTDPNFVATVWDELKRGREAIAPTIADTLTADGNLKLFQPIHRTFHVAVLEAVCDPYGTPEIQPRLDPKQIDSAGLVVRRYGTGDRSGKIEGWRQQGSDVRGWLPFADSLQGLTQDPDMSQRPPLLQAGNAEINRRLSLLQAVEDTLSETITPLFVAPRDVCQAAQKTLLYGLISISGGDLSQAETIQFDDAFIQDHLPTYLKAADRTKRVPRPGQTLTARDASDDDPFLQDFIAAVRQVQNEFEAFREGKSTPLFKALNQIRLPFGESTRRAGDFLKDTAQVLVDRGSGSVTLPDRWPAVTPDQARAIAAAVKTVLDRRLGAAQPQRRRFDDDNRRYYLQAFIRVKQPDGCPPRLVWSPPSADFTIAPWYENANVAPVQVTLPDLLNPDQLRRLKPSVAFSVPANLFNSLNGMNLQDLLDGKKPSGGGVAIDWICSFNIPIITLCAFIVLNIFLQLLNFIFQWLLFIKICIPIPRPNDS